MKAAVLAATALLFAGTAGAETAGTTPEATEAIHVFYDAKAGCPDEAAFLERVGARTSRMRRASDAEPGRSFRVRFDVQRRQTVGELVIRELDGTEAARSVPAATCDEVVSAMALIAAIAIDARAAEREAPPPEPIAPLPPPAPPPPPEAPERAWDLHAGVHFYASGATSPRVMLGPEAFVELARRPKTLFAPAIRLSLLGGLDSVEKAPYGTADFNWFAARGQACPIRWPKTWSLSPCAFAEIGRLSGSGSETPSPATQSRVWAAWGTLLRLQGALWDVLLVEAEAGITLPLVRGRFYFSPDATAFEIPSIAPMGSIGVGARIP